MADEYRRLRISSSAESDREWLLAEAFEQGAEGAEEIEGSASGAPFDAWVYGPAGKMEGIRRSLLEIAPAGTSLSESEALPEVDWSEAWKEGLEALEISARLVVRPPFVEFALKPGQQEIVIDPGQAFGTGGHASTYLCLDWIDVLYHEASEASEAGGSGGRLARVLDVGTGSGVLAMAAVRLGGRSAVGFDLDAVAIEAAVEAARRNQLADRTQWFAKPIEEVLPDETFDLVLANLLKREVLPIATEVAARLAPGGRLVLAGLLSEDEDEVLTRFAEEGLAPAREKRTIEDGTGLWVGLCLERDQSAASSADQ